MVRGSLIYIPSKGGVCKPTHMPHAAHGSPAEAVKEPGRHARHRQPDPRIRKESRGDHHVPRLPLRIVRKLRQPRVYRRRWCRCCLGGGGRRTRARAAAAHLRLRWCRQVVDGRLPQAADGQREEAVEEGQRAQQQRAAGLLQQSHYHKAEGEAARRPQQRAAAAGARPQLRQLWGGGGEGGGVSWLDACRWEACLLDRCTIPSAASASASIGGDGGSVSSGRQHTWMGGWCAWGATQATPATTPNIACRGEGEGGAGQGSE